jgi:hypothetical protein
MAEITRWRTTSTSTTSWRRCIEQSSTPCHWNYTASHSRCLFPPRSTLCVVEIYLILFVFLIFDRQWFWKEIREPFNALFYFQHDLIAEMYEDIFDHRKREFASAESCGRFCMHVVGRVIPAGWLEYAGVYDAIQQHDEIVPGLSAQVERCYEDSDRGIDRVGAHGKHSDQNTVDSCHQTETYGFMMILLGVCREEPRLHRI